MHARQGLSVLGAMAFTIPLMIGTSPKVAYACKEKGCGSACDVQFGLAGEASAVAAPSIIGTTPSEIQANFQSVILNNFRSGDPSKIIRSLSSKELADLATLYGKATFGNTSALLSILAEKLNATDLVRVASAFGETATVEAVDLHAPARVAQQFFALPQLSGTQSSSIVAAAAGAAVAQPAGKLGYTIYEIYLDYRTAPFGSLGVSDALYETASDVASGVGWAWLGGVTLGTGINDLIETYDPSLEDAIGGTVGGMAQDIQDATTELIQGNYEYSFDQLFGMPLPEDTSGDFGVVSPMHYYYIQTTGC